MKQETIQSEGYVKKLIEFKELVDFIKDIDSWQLLVFMNVIDVNLDKLLWTKILNKVRWTKITCKVLKMKIQGTLSVQGSRDIEANFKKVKDDLGRVWHELRVTSIDTGHYLYIKAQEITFYV